MALSFVADVTTGIFATGLTRPFLPDDPDAFQLTRRSSSVGGQQQFSIADCADRSVPGGHVDSTSA